MLRGAFFLLVAIAAAPLACAGGAQESSDAVAQAVAQGDTFFSQRKYEKAREAYLKADKLAHHTDVLCLLRIFKVDRQTGDLSAALDDAKRALKAAGDNKNLAVQAHQARGTLLAQMASKPNDKKLQEAEKEFREALALDPGEPVAHYNLGMVLLKQERDSEGIAELKGYLASPRADPRTLSEARRIIANPIRAREPFAPDFSFTTQEGAKVSNATLRGNVVLLDFWATWCPACREAMPTLQQIHKRYKSRPFQIVGISSDDDEEAWTSFIATKRLDWSEYRDSSGQVGELFGVNALPTFIVLDRDGIIRYRQAGLSDRTPEELEDTINKALKRPSQAAAAALTAPAYAESGGVAGQNPAPAAPAAVEKTPTGSSAEATEVGSGAVSGNVYRNHLLGLAYEFPLGWIAAKPEALRAANESAQASVKAQLLQQSPESGGNAAIIVPKIIFYASPSGKGDGRLLAIPSLLITAGQWNSSELTLDAVKSEAEQMGRQGMTLARGPEEYTVSERQFFRADFENTLTNPHSWMSRIHVLVGGYLVTLETIAASREQLEQLVLTTQNLSFATP